jgi:polyferredoxin
MFPNWQGRHSQRRRHVQLGFLAVFVVLPLFDLLRFDFVAGRLHLFRQEIWLDEWAILWLALMFGMWLIGAASLLLGRVYCAYACPQTVFTELAHDIDALARRLTRRLLPPRRQQVARALSLLLVALLALVGTVLLMGYFAPLPEVLARLLRLDVGPWIGAVGAITTALAFLDLAFVRESFCRSACPYGLLQGVIEDGRSLHVRLDESAGRCIDCAACVRTCPMGIDIRHGSFQIECTRCGSCIDSCDAVLGRLKTPRPGVLRFDFAGVGRGGWDAKRVLVAVATAGFGIALSLALVTRERVALRLSPLYTTEQSAADGRLETRFLLRASNRGSEELVLEAQTQGLPAGAIVSGLEDPRLPAGQKRTLTLSVSLPREQVTASVLPFAWVLRAGGQENRLAAAFFAARAVGRKGVS